jgi:hypothetical protein
VFAFVPASGLGPWRIELAILNLLALVLLVVVLRALAADPRRRRFIVSALISTAVVAAAFGLAVRPSDIPIEWVTILHEGMGYKSILQLYASASHAGAAFYFVVALVGGSHPTLHDLVWLNLLLALIDATLFLHIAIYVAGPVWGVVWTLVFALNPPAFLAAFSELPTHLLALYFQIGLLAWVVLNDPAPRRKVRIAAYALCAIITVLVFMVRAEVSLIGLLALGLHTAYALLGEERWAVATQRLWRASERPLAFLADHLGLVAVLTALAWWLTQAGIPPLGRSELGGFYPFNPALFSIFVFLPMLLLPIGVSVAVAFGLVHSLRHFRRFGGLGLSVLILVRTYFAAQNQYYEAGRYLSYVFPALFLLGLFGKPQFDAMVAGWRPYWARLAQVLYVMAWFTRALPGVPDWYLRPEYHAGEGFAQVLLDRNSQREVRYLMRITEQNPECVFVARVVQHGRRVEPRQYDYVFFGAPIAAPIFIPERDGPLAQAIARAAPGASCVRLYFGGDCNLTENDGCTEFIAGRRLVESTRFWSRLFNNPADFGYATGEVVLGVYAWP